MYIVGGVYIVVAWVVTESEMTVWTSVFCYWAAMLEWKVRNGAKNVRVGKNILDELNVLVLRNYFNTLFCFKELSTHRTK